MVKAATIDKRYHVVRQIAEGGVCAVFEATHCLLGRPVALKRLTEQRRQNGIARERLLQEARVLCRVQHDGVVSTFDAGVTDEGDPYLVMELLQGRPLSGLITSRKKLELWPVLSVAKRLADALMLVHERGILHRDLKPGNIFIAQREQGGEAVKLLDFGIARVQRSGEKLTLDGELLGTPEYMAPEQLMLQELDARADLYSLAVVLYECLSGTVPFTGSFGEVLLKASTTRPRPLHELSSGVPLAVSQVIQRALASDKEQRFPTVAHFSNALIAAAGGRLRELELLGSSGVTLDNGGEPDKTPTQSANGEQRGAQRRRYVRAPYITPVRVLCSDGASFDGRSEDISEGGLLVMMDGPLKSKEAVVARFALPTDGRIIEVRAEQKWLSLGRSKQALGLEFIDLAAQERSKIATYVELMRKR